MCYSLWDVQLAKHQVVELVFMLPVPACGFDLEVFLHTDGELGSRPSSHYSSFISVVALELSCDLTIDISKQICYLDISSLS